MRTISQFHKLSKLSFLLNFRPSPLYGHDPRRRIMASPPMAPPKCQHFLEFEAMEIFNTGVTSVLPGSMVKNALKIEKRCMIVNNIKYPLDHNVHIIGFGKAVLGMACAAEEVLGDHVAGGILSIPSGTMQTIRKHNKLDMIPSEDSRLIVYEGAPNNIPDEIAQEAAMAIYEYVKSLTAKDICLTLITGGGSALLPAIVPPLTLADIAQLTCILSLSGADISQMNTIRKNLDILKGGGLAAAAQPAKVVSLILSDVIGNNLEMIASGPTVSNHSSPQQCMDLMRMLKVTDKVPSKVNTFLEEAAIRHKTAQGKIMTFSQVDKSDSDVGALHDVSNAQNVIVGSNNIMLASAQEMAEKLGYLTFILTDELKGDASIAAEMFIDLATFACLTMGNKRRHDMQRSLVGEEMDLVRKGILKKTVNKVLNLAECAANRDRPLCILAGGETIVKVTGTGKGGRNQEMALWAAVHLQDKDKDYNLGSRFGIEFLSAGTDGFDGPTDVAGAFVTPSTLTEAEEMGLSAEQYLNNNDSYNFFANLNDGKNFIRTGFTGTNVMDLQVLLIKQPDIKSELL